MKKIVTVRNLDAALPCIVADFPATVKGLLSNPNTPEMEVCYIDMEDRHSTLHKVTLSNLRGETVLVWDEEVAIPGERGVPAVEPPIDGMPDDELVEVDVPNIRSIFISSFTSASKEANEIAHEHGFWDIPEELRESLFIDAAKIALMHHELGECLESLREGNPKSEKIPPFTQVEEELADCIIRIMDYAFERDLALAGALIDKMDYNRRRPHKHGKEF